MTDQIAVILAKRLIKIYTKHKLPKYTNLNRKFPEGFVKARIKRNPKDSLFQMIILSTYDRWPFTQRAGGFEPIWGLVDSGPSLPSILRSVNLFNLNSAIASSQTNIHNCLGGCSFFNLRLDSYGKTQYSKAFKETASVVGSLLSDIRKAKVASEVSKIHKKLDSIHGIGPTIASKLIMYCFRELPFFGSSIHPRELYPAIEPILKEYHNAVLVKELKKHYGDGIVKQVLEALKELGDPFAIDALFYIDRDEPELKKCLLKRRKDEADDKEEEMSRENNCKLEITLPPQKMDLLRRIAKEEFDLDECTLAKIWIIERLLQLGTAKLLPMGGLITTPELPVASESLEDTKKRLGELYICDPDEKRLFLKADSFHDWAPYIAGRVLHQKGQEPFERKNVIEILEKLIHHHFGKPGATKGNILPADVCWDPPKSGRNIKFPSLEADKTKKPYRYKFLGFKGAIKKKFESIS